MFFFYRILTEFLYPFLILLVIIRKFFNKEDSIRFKEKIFISNFNIKRKNNTKLIWFHAASIGEFKSILPIIEQLNHDKDNLEFLITTVTLSSSNIAAEELKKFNNVQHRFFPLDINFLMKKFLFLWKPYAIFLVDSEIWPNLILAANENKIPLALINARITTKTYKRWKIIPKTASRIFSTFSLCLCSNLETKNNLLEFNANKVFYAGNIKLINKINYNKIKNVNEDFLIQKRFWVSANTHANEEILSVKTHLKIKEKYNDIVTIIVPRHIDRVNGIEKLCKNYNLKVQILEKNEIILEGKEIIIINSFGILTNYFKYAKSVFIGKSTIKKLERVGGQNPIDAAKLGCKIYHGRYIYNFKEIYEILKKNNITQRIDNYTELSNYLINDLDTPKRQDNKISNLINSLGQKTLADTMKNINNFLFNEIK